LATVVLLDYGASDETPGPPRTLRKGAARAYRILHNETAASRTRARGVEIIGSLGSGTITQGNREADSRAKS
jgi:hypothetical protein